MKRVLMCPPEHYDVLYEINPWMKVKNPIQPDRAMDQWKQLHAILTQLGVEVLTIPQHRESPDMVFTANAGIVSNKIFIPSHFRFPERQGEEPFFKRFFQKHGYRIMDAAKGYFFEGEGDQLSYRDILFGGYRYRSEIRAHEQVSGVLKKRFVGLDLIRPRFYHLDTCFFPLDAKSVVYYPGAFDQYGCRVIQEFVQDPIPVSREDAQAFACNAFRVGHTVILNKASGPLKKRLKKKGYEVIETPTSEFIKAGGSVKCLILML